jgi:hypothetical protein
LHFKNYNEDDKEEEEEEKTNTKAFEEAKKF